jgi:class 3 adenylate cyclase
MTEAMTVPSEDATAWRFEDTAVAPKTGLVVVYDLEDFTSFLALPDIQHAATRYLNHVDAEVRTIYSGEYPGYAARPAKPIAKEHFYPVGVPVHRKFLGDGAMFIFDVTTLDAPKRELLLREVCVRAWNTKNLFHHINAAAREFMPVAIMPKRIRFGITYGTIYELARSDGQLEYIGFPINLAARLQKYSGAASFLASARINLPHNWFAKLGFVKVRPLKLRNASDEYIYIDKNDLSRATKGLFEVVVEPPPPPPSTPPTQALVVPTRRK